MDSTADAFILYPIYVGESKVPMRDGNFYLAEKHLFKIVGSDRRVIGGKVELLPRLFCVARILIKVPVEKAKIGKIFIWGIRQKIA